MWSKQLYLTASLSPYSVYLYCPLCHRTQQQQQDEKDKEKKKKSSSSNDTISWKLRFYGTLSAVTAGTHFICPVEDADRDTSVDSSSRAIRQGELGERRGEGGSQRTHTMCIK